MHSEYTIDVVFIESVTKKKLNKHIYFTCAKPYLRASSQLLSVIFHGWNQGSINFPCHPPHDAILTLYSYTQHFTHTHKIEFVLNLCSC